MLNCSFELNGEPLSDFKVGSQSFLAFSGLDPYINSGSGACRANLGPIPPGSYYICDRRSGGMLGPLRDAFRDRSGWFALYTIDGKIDDETYCEQIKRGAFRLHPKGPYGISKGCIVIDSRSDFDNLSIILRRATPTPVNDSKLLAYGKVTVR